MDPDTQPMDEAARLRRFVLAAGGGPLDGAVLAALVGAERGWVWTRTDEGWTPDPLHPVPPVEARAQVLRGAATPTRESRAGRDWWLVPADSTGMTVLQVELDPAASEPDLELLCAAARWSVCRVRAGEGAEAKRLRAVLEHSERLSQLGKMAAGIAHEVGNPLAGISSIVQTLLVRTEDETARERLKLVKEQVGRINAIIRQLVEYSRPSTERPRPIDLNELVRETARLMRFEPRARGVDLTLELDDHLPQVPVRAHQVQQVFLNLFHNAMDATEGLGWRSVRVHSGREGDYAVFRVTDNGRGMTEEVRARLFDPFFTTKEPGRGTGLGLWICQGIVESLGGDLSLDGAPGQGTCVTVRIRTTNEAEHPGG